MAKRKVKNKRKGDKGIKMKQHNIKWMTKALILPREETAHLIQCAIDMGIH